MLAVLPENPGSVPSTSYNCKSSSRTFGSLSGLCRPCTQFTHTCSFKKMVIQVSTQIGYSGCYGEGFGVECIRQLSTRPMGILTVALVLCGNGSLFPPFQGQNSSYQVGSRNFCLLSHLVIRSCYQDASNSEVIPDYLRLGFIAVKRHHSHGNSYKKHLIGSGLLLF